MRGGYGTCFCSPGTEFYGHYECRGTSLNEATNLSLVTKFVAGTGAVSRYRLSRCQESVPVQNFDCGQLWESGYRKHYKSVLVAEAKAKTVTNNLPLLSVLANVIIFKIVFRIELQL